MSSPTGVVCVSQVDDDDMMDSEATTWPSACVMPPSAKRSVLPLHVDAAAIRARYVPEVRGMPRVRHFHGKGERVNGGSNNGNIDSANYVAELPYLIQPARQFQQFQNEMNMDIAPGVSALSIVKKRRVKKTREILPSLKGNPPEKDEKTTESISKQVEKKKRSIAMSNSTSSEASLKSFSGVRLNDVLSAKGTSRVFESPRASELNGITEDSTSLNVRPPVRSKSAHDIQSEPFTELNEVPSTSTYSLRGTKDTATQTANFATQTTIEDLAASANVIATQTEAVPIVLQQRRKSEAYYTREMMEERGALLELIEDALDETIDRYSRLRTNQIIASSARKQAQIWRDAKEFVMGTLVPQSVHLANQSRVKKRTAAEIVANIRFYP